jgi:hypothetical protein
MQNSQLVSGFPLSELREQQGDQDRRRYEGCELQELSGEIAKARLSKVRL